MTVTVNVIECIYDINGNNSNLLCGNVNFTLSMNFTINMIVTMTITMSLIVTITMIFSVYVCRYKCDFECNFDCESVCVYNNYYIFECVLTLNFTVSVS